MIMNEHNKSMGGQTSAECIDDANELSVWESI